MRLVAAFAASGLLAACATTNVNSFAARGVDFTQFRTYGWGAEVEAPTGDPRLDSNPFFRTRILASAERELAARGFEKVSSGTPDLVLHYHASVRQRLDLSTVDQKYGECDTCGASVFDQGTLTLDLVDPRTNKLVWRGWSERSLEGVIDNQDVFEKQIDQAVARIVRQVPRTL
jgi:hypothetical protein